MVQEAEKYKAEDEELKKIEADGLRITRTT